MTLQQTLRRLDELHAEIDHASRRLEELEEAGTCVTSRWGEIYYGGVTKRSKVETSVLGSVDLEKELAELEQEQTRIFRWIRPLIERLPPGTRRTIMRWRFLEGMGCVAISWRLHYSRSYVYKAIAAGMREIARQWGRKEEPLA